MQISVSNFAKEDLIDIWLYGHDVWGEDLADMYLDDLYAAISSLTFSPYRYPEQSGENTVSFRLMPIRSHLIAYEVLETEIFILRVLHKSMEKNTQISGNT